MRSARTGDIRNVKLLLTRCNLPDQGIEDQFVEGFVVAEQAGEIVGVAGVERYGGHGLLRSVAVAETCRGESIGRKLVDECLDRAWQRAIEEVYLLTTDARAYFEKLGFETIDRDRVPANIAGSPEFASICPTTATVMVLLSPRERSRSTAGNQ